MTTYALQHINYLNATGRTHLAEKMAQGKVSFWNKVRLFFSNLWHVNKLRLPAAVLSAATGATAVGLGGLVIPGPGWVVSGTVALGLTMLGAGLFLTSVNSALRVTWDQLLTLETEPATGSSTGDTPPVPHLENPYV